MESFVTHLRNDFLPCIVDGHSKAHEHNLKTFNKNTNEKIVEHKIQMKHIVMVFQYILYRISNICPIINTPPPATTFHTQYSRNTQK